MIWLNNQSPECFLSSSDWFCVLSLTFRYMPQPRLGSGISLSRWVSFVSFSSSKITIYEQLLLTSLEERVGLPLFPDFFVTSVHFSKSIHQLHIPLFLVRIRIKHFITTRAQLCLSSIPSTVLRLDFPCWLNGNIQNVRTWRILWNTYTEFFSLPNAQHSSTQHPLVPRMNTKTFTHKLGKCAWHLSSIPSLKAWITILI